MRISVRGRIGAPQGEKAKGREITVNIKEECDKLPLDKYPVTGDTDPDGIGVTLSDGYLECEASFHRYPKSSYIGTARKRSRSTDYTKQFRKFLEEVGIVDAGTSVKLEFEEHRVHISRISEIQ